MAETEDIARVIHSMLADGSVVWIGSGLSVPDYPGWRSIFAKLCEACEVVVMEPKPSTNRMLEIMDMCRDKDPDSFDKCLEDAFGQISVGNRRAYQLLTRLPFYALVTSNFDPLLLVNNGEVDENRKHFVYPNLPPHAMNVNSPPSFYIHGCARKNNKPDAERLVVCKSDYDQAYASSGGRTRAFIEGVISYYNILFVGCSLAETEFERVFKCIEEGDKVVRKLTPTAPIPKRKILTAMEFVNKKGPEAEEELVESEEYSRTKERLTAMGIEVLEFKKKSDDYRELDEILSELSRIHGLNIGPSPELSPFPEAQNA